MLVLFNTAFLKRDYASGVRSFSTQSGVKLPPPEATAVSPDWSLFPLNRIFKQRAVYLSSTLG
ncbi:hypothetical protein T4A_9319 [Trichinella pseudospiralis]|uniref:Uncharacterized protein n=1 Tax=Trichinella pseudospiralis TaxID=6337 RepID=A0A0V1DS88_TRIPS|nr:hypothetical protein T4A_9319 [Trichinella pseudospiralis]KRY80606.1 hypothetical protein T4D_4301 [Trichinella pseudospiralis]